MNKNIISLQCPFNQSKMVQFKQSICHHFYQRQLIDGYAVTNWQRQPKKFILATMQRFNKTTLI
jgi:hypothetical protein